jgi:hypothetical protein
MHEVWSLLQMKVKRMFQMSKLEQCIMLMIWSDIKNLPHYDTWRSYERAFKFEEKPYRYKCKYRVEGGHLRIIEAKIEHEQVVINILH